MISSSRRSSSIAQCFTYSLVTPVERWSLQRPSPQVQSTLGLGAKSACLTLTGGLLGMAVDTGDTVSAEPGPKTMVFLGSLEQPAELCNDPP